MTSELDLFLRFRKFVAKEVATKLELAILERIEKNGFYYRPATAREVRIYQRWKDDLQVVTQDLSYFEHRWWVFDGVVRK